MKAAQGRGGLTGHPEPVLGSQGKSEGGTAMPPRPKTHRLGSGEPWRACGGRADRKQAGQAGPWQVELCPPAVLQSSSEVTPQGQASSMVIPSLRTCAETTDSQASECELSWGIRSLQKWENKELTLPLVLHFFLGNSNCNIFFYLQFFMTINGCVL